MHNRFVTWIKKNKKTLIISAAVIAVVGTVAVVLIGNEKNVLPIKELAERLQSGSTNQAKSAASTVINKSASVIETESTLEAIEVKGDESIKIIQRSEFIRKLHEGWKPSARKIAEATEKGIILNEGETLVDECTVRLKAA